jgi:thiol-disulfide isomerase/thioredoxin
VFHKSLDRAELDRFKADALPAVVRFSSEHRPRSVQLNQDWLRFEQRYEAEASLRIGHVNCGKYPRLCLREGVWDPPAVRLYANESAFAYDGGMSHESLGAWTRNLTGVQGAEPRLGLLSPNNRTFHELVSKRSCVFVMFHTPWCRKCRRLMPALRRVAEAFRAENVSICEIDADKFKSFLFDFELREFPSLRLFQHTNVLAYEKPIEKNAIIGYINGHCGTNAIDNDNSSTPSVDDLRDLVEDFMRTKDAKYIRVVEAVGGTATCVAVMRTVLRDGTDWIALEHERLSRRLREGEVREKAIEQMQQKLAILRLFLNFADD